MIRVHLKQAVFQLDLLFDLISISAINYNILLYKIYTRKRLVSRVYFSAKFKKISRMKASQETLLGCISLEKTLIRIPNPKPDFLFLWQNPKGDYESNESVHKDDSMD